MTGSRSKKARPPRPGGRSRRRSVWIAAPLILVIAGTSAAAVVLPAWSKTSQAPFEDSASTQPQRDPWGRFNRGSYRVGGFLDKVLIGPATRVYMKITPRPLRRGLGNVVSNLREPSTALNGLAQGRPRLAGKATARFVMNSTVGVLGLFDVAGRAGLEKERADLGQTLGRYGVGTGPYLYLPVIGPTNVRDGLGSAVGALIDPVSLATGGAATDFAAGRAVVGGLDARAAADATLSTIAREATDPYATTRSAYLQYREAVVREATGEEEVLPEFEAPVEDPDLLGAPPPLTEADSTPAPGG